MSIVSSRTDYFVSCNYLSIDIHSFINILIMIILQNKFSLHLTSTKMKYYACQIYFMILFTLWIKLVRHMQRIFEYYDIFMTTF